MKLTANTPRRVANLWVTYNLTPSLSSSIDRRYVSARLGNHANTIGDGGYTLLGASLGYRIGRRTSVVLRGRNLTDKVYAASITGTPMFFLGAPRSVDLTLRTTF